jgi:hypothetical protein
MCPGSYFHNPAMTARLAGRESVQRIPRILAWSVVLFLMGGSADRCVAETGQGWKHKWIATVAALTAANVADAWSSRGLREANPLLRGPGGQFSSGRAIAVKSAAAGGFVALQLILLKRMPERNLYQPFAIATGAAAGTTGAVAIRNFTLPHRAPPEHLRRE